MTGFSKQAELDLINLFSHANSEVPGGAAPPSMLPQQATENSTSLVAIDIDNGASTKTVGDMVGRSGSSRMYEI